MRGSRTIVIGTHVPGEDGGNFLSFLKEREFQPKIVKLYQGEALPTPENYDGLILMGGLESANSDSVGMRRQIRSVQEAIEAKKPFLGICLGLQILTKAAGGNVIHSPQTELGFRASYEIIGSRFFALRVTKEGKKDHLFKGLPETITPVFQLHEDIVTLAKNMKYPVKVLAESADGAIGVLRVSKNAYGIQSHWEITPKRLDLAFDTYSSLWNLDTQVLRQDFEKFEKKHAILSKKMFNNWLDIVEAV